MSFAMTAYDAQYDDNVQHEAQYDDNGQHEAQYDNAEYAAAYYADPDAENMD
jgi:hypothetical protein